MEMTRSKKRILILNKADLADPEENERWKTRLEAEGETVLLLDARRNASFQAVRTMLGEAASEKREKDRLRGILNRPVRVMAAGIPNVGKSTFINSLAGRASARTGDKPGVTRGNQWIRLSRTLDLLDTPGILWPKFEDPAVGISLAMAGSVSDDVVDTESLAAESILRIERLYPGRITGYYEVLPGEPHDVLRAMALNRGCLRSGGEPDTGRVSKLLMTDIRKAALGRLSFERAEELS